MKITENEVEVARRQSVIAPIVVVVVVVLSVCALLFRHQRLRSCSAQEDTGENRQDVVSDFKKCCHYALQKEGEG